MNIVGPLGLAAVLLGAPAHAAQGSDPDWPCVQRKVEHLSLGVMWPNPQPENAAPLPEDLRDVAHRMALRRVPVEEIDRQIGELAAEHPDIGAETYALVFAEAFELIDRQRARILNGIARYARGQAALSEQIEALRAEFAEVEAQEDPDSDRLDQLEAEIDWRERVFDERNSALNYVCESPVLLEKRAYAIAQLLLRRID